MRKRLDSSHQCYTPIRQLALDKATGLVGIRVSPCNSVNSEVLNPSSPPIQADILSVNNLDAIQLIYRRSLL